MSIDRDIRLSQRVAKVPFTLFRDKQFQVFDLSEVSRDTSVLWSNGMEFRWLTAAGRERILPKNRRASADAG